MTAAADGERKNASLGQALRMVFSAFFGVRRRDDHDQVRITPAQVIVAGILAGALFVTTIVTVVKLVTR